MTKDEFDLLEVKAEDVSWYLVTLYQFDKEDTDTPDYFQEWLFYNGDDWEYTEEYEGTCLVCFIHEKDSEE